MKMHSVPDRFIVQLPADTRLREFGVEQGPGALKKNDNGRFVVRDLTDSQRAAIEKAGGRVFDNRPMAIPEPMEVEPLGDRGQWSHPPDHQHARYAWRRHTPRTGYSRAGHRPRHYRQRHCFASRL